MKKLTEQPAQPITIIKKAAAAKLSPKSQGELQYEIGTHNDSKQVHIRIAANSSGGYFSGEWISIETIEQCLSDRLNTEPAFRSSVLRSAFQQGKSANNAGFLAAILRQENVLSPDEKNGFQHHYTGDIAQWKQQVLSGNRRTAAKAALAPEKP